MPSFPFDPTEDPRVAISTLSAEYAGLGDARIKRAIQNVSEALGWTSDRRGAFGNVIPKGARVVVKPNFVLHENQGGGGFLPLITHPSLVVAAVEEALRAEPSELIVGDAPVQSCEFQELVQKTGLDNWSDRLREIEPRFKGIVDFRRTIAKFRNGTRQADENVRGEENYVLFNLGVDSLLEPLTDDGDNFRVTCYDPRLMAKTHSSGNHQYLIAKEIIDADVIINIPKLKTHKKAGITGALKNLVGINGNKEYLPHHRVGGSASGGDCYPGRNPAKRMLESVLDFQNTARTKGGQRLFSGLAGHLERSIRLTGDKIGVEGSWIGNQTVPRMTLDLNRILLYGRANGTLGTGVQRQILNIVDAVIAGQGDGPLAPDALEMGLIFAGHNAAALDWFGAEQLGYDPEKIPLLELAFQEFKWPVTRFAVGALDCQWVPSAETPVDGKRKNVISANVPAGWRGAVRSTT